MQEGCEFLIRELDDGRLDLRDTFVYYLDADMYLRPQPPAGLPSAPTHFEELEWAAEYTGDIMFGKPPYKRARHPPRPPAAPDLGLCASCGGVAVQTPGLACVPCCCPDRQSVWEWRPCHASWLVLHSLGRPLCDVGMMMRSDSINDA